MENHLNEGEIAKTAEGSFLQRPVCETFATLLYLIREHQVSDNSSLV